MSFFKNGDYESAKYHFEQVLSSTTLPVAVRKNVNIFLARIRQILPTFNLSLNLSFNIGISFKKNLSFYQAPRFGIKQKEGQTTGHIMPLFHI